MSYRLAVTNKCNWNCHYCVTDIHKQKEILFENVLKEAQQIPIGSSVSFGNGEPGMLPRRQLEELIRVTKERQCTIHLMTNGLVFKRNLDLVEQFDSVRYHCVENLTDDIEYPDLDQTKITYCIVGLTEEIENGTVLKFMDRYPHITFELAPDCRRTRKVNLNSLMKFYNDHKHRFTSETLQHFIACVAWTH